MLTSPALFRMVSSRSASTRAISTLSHGALSRPGKTGALLSSRLDTDSSLATAEAGSSGGAARSFAKDGGASMDAAKSDAAAIAGVTAAGVTAAGVTAAGVTAAGVTAASVTAAGVAAGGGGAGRGANGATTAAVPS